MHGGTSLLDRDLSDELARLRAADLYRVRRTVQGGHGADIVVDGNRCVNFCSNDYLGLANDPRPAAAARRVLADVGTGSGAAALVSGYNVEHARLEEELADFIGQPRTLMFSSGWAANLGVLRALLGPEDRIIADELNHASLIDGGRLCRASYQRVPHANTDAITAILAADCPKTRRTIVVTDSVFSMDGDLADLPVLSQNAAAYDALLMVDDAHGFGVLGAKGAGALEHFSEISGTVSAIPEVYVATLGKALGAAGAFVAGSEALIEYLIQRARTWVFSTAPPPALAAAARTALGIVRTEPWRRQQLRERIQRLRRGAAALGLPIGESQTAIQPLILGDAARSLALSHFLFDRGYWVAAIRPPTVPQGTSRLRITLSAAHTDQQVDGLLVALAEGLEHLSSKVAP